jgi:hypothetical protein
MNESLHRKTILAAQRRSAIRGCGLVVFLASLLNWGCAGAINV